MDTFTLLCAIFAATGSFLFGYDSGIITTTISHDSFLHYMKTSSDSQEIGALTSTYAAGEAIGAILGMFYNDKLGRKRSIQLSAVLATIGTVIQTASVNIGMLIGGRIIAGIAIGNLLLLCPVYNAEISTAGTRGLIVGVTGQMIGFGFMVSNWIGFACSYADYGDVQWRLPLGLQIPWGVILFFGMFYLPESPRWLTMQGRFEDALGVLRRLHSQETEEFVLSEYEQMKDQISYEQANEVKSIKLLFQKYRKRMMLGIGIQSLTQLTGINVINYYQTNLYKGVGITGHTVLLLSSIYDKWGRVRALWITAIALACDLAIVMGLTYKYDVSGSQVVSGFAIAFIFIFSIIYSLGFNSISWIYTCEIFPANIRARGSALSTFANFVTNIVFNQISPHAFGQIGYKYYAVFLCINMATAAIIFFTFPETKQKSLEEIAELFGDDLVVPDLKELIMEHQHKTEVIHKSQSNDGSLKPEGSTEEQEPVKV